MTSLALGFKMSKIYQPSEDSYLLSNVLKKQIKNKNMKCLDMGSGSGIQSKTLIKLGIKQENLTIVDINLDAVKNLKKQFPKSKVIQSDLFSNFKGGNNVRGILASPKFDLIVFNPPYLPEDKYDKEKDTTGGKKGSEIINRFLKQSKKYLSENGIIFLLTSSLTKGINWQNYDKKLLSKQKLFFEELYVWELTS